MAALDILPSRQLGPAIKLTPMQSVPWTKAWGMMFLCSFLLFETMVYTRRNDGYVIVAQDTLLDRQAQRHMKNFSAMDHKVFNIGIVLHIALLLWAIINIWSLRGIHYHDVYFQQEWPEQHRELLWPASLMPPAAALGALFVVFSSITTLALFYGLWITAYDSLWISDDTWSVKAYVILTRIFMSFFTSCLFVIEALDIAPTGYLVGLPILVVLIGAVPLAMLVVLWLCRKLPELRKKLLLGPASNVKNGPWFNLEISNLGNLMFFLANLAVCVAWYSLKYEPEGTVNPRWTGIFGLKIGPIY